MPSNVSFYFVDVFAVGPLTGNPVAVVPDADDLPQTTMQALAREFNQSETTFVLRPDRPDATWRLRSFTPIGAEVLGAGHNALGTWLWLASSGRLGERPAGRYVQQIGDDLLPVTVTMTGHGSLEIAMVQSPPRFGGIVDDRAGLAGALGLSPADLAGEIPAQVVSTGAGHLLVSLRDRAAVDRAVPDTARLADALKMAGGEGCYVYTRETVDPDSAAYARFFNPTMGIWEDPATGTAAGPLAALLTILDKSSERTVVIEQGHAIGRPSRIRVTVEGEVVTVSGGGLVIAEGHLTL